MSVEVNCKGSPREAETARTKYRDIGGFNQITVCRLWMVSDIGVGFNMGDGKFRWTFGASDMSRVNDKVGGVNVQMRGQGSDSVYELVTQRAYGNVDTTSPFS